jgi:hypothetical protein
MGHHEHISLEKRSNPVGEQGKDALRVTFDRKLKLEFLGTKVTCDADAGECYG